MARASRSWLPTNCRQRARLTAHEPENNGNYNADHCAGDNRKIKAKMVTLDGDVSWQTSQPKLPEIGPGDAEQDQKNPDDNKPLLHDRTTAGASHLTR